MRVIKPALVKWLDERLATNGLAQDAIKRRLPRQLLIEAAGACVGVREASGDNDGPIVELFQSTIGKAAREPYCLGGVQSCIAYVELILSVQSPIYATEHVLTCWNETSKLQRVTHLPQPGAIVMYQHGHTTNGHCGILREFDPTLGRMRLVEWNTGAGIDPEDRVVRDGDGVYFTVRSTAGTGDMRVLGFLKPFSPR